jgi:hypothetical protein
MHSCPCARPCFLTYPCLSHTHTHRYSHSIWRQLSLSLSLSLTLLLILALLPRGRWRAGLPVPVRPRLAMHVEADWHGPGPAVARVHAQVRWRRAVLLMPLYPPSTQQAAPPLVRPSTCVHTHRVVRQRMDGAGVSCACVRPPVHLCLYNSVGTRYKPLSHRLSLSRRTARFKVAQGSTE